MKQLFILLLLFVSVTIAPSMVFAQGMMGSTDSPQVETQSTISSDGHTTREEAEGKEVWGLYQF